MWQRQIHVVSAIAPAEALAEEAEHRRRLRVVDDDVVVVALEQQRVVEHLLEVDALHRRGPLDVGALQRVVHRLGDGEELVAAVHHLPVGVDADAPEQRHVGGEQLGDAAAVRGGVEVEDPRALERLGQLADAVDRRRCRPRPRSRRGASRAGGRGRARTLRWCTGTGISVNLSSDGLRTGVPRQVQGHARRGRGRGARWRRGCAAPGSTTSPSCRSPTAARARSTRCSRRAAVRAVTRPSPGRSAIRSTRSGRSCPVGSRWSRWRARAVSRSCRASSDPLRASTRGTGELIAAAIRAGARRVVVGVGGSATTDGGPRRARGARLVARRDAGHRRVRRDDAASSMPPGCSARRRARATRRSRCSPGGSRSWPTSTSSARASTSASSPAAGAAGGLAGGLAAIGAELEPGFDVVAGAAGLGDRRSTASTSWSPARAGSTPPASRARWWAGCSSGRPTPGVPHAAVIAGQVTDRSARRGRAACRRAAARAHRPGVAVRRRRSPAPPCWSRRPRSKPAATCCAHGRESSQAESSRPNFARYAGTVTIGGRSRISTETRSACWSSS